MSNAFAKPNYIYKRFRVKRADGGSTTVSIDPALVVQACKVLGSLATVGRVVREAAAKFVPSEPNGAKNRSAHVTRTLQAIVEGKGLPAATPAAEMTEAQTIENDTSVEASANTATEEITASGEGVLVDSAA